MWHIFSGRINYSQKRHFSPVQLTCLGFAKNGRGWEMKISAIKMSRRIPESAQFAINIQPSSGDRHVLLCFNYLSIQINLINVQLSAN